MTGWTDANGNAADGCEYQCTFEGLEVCDGRDNDCDGLTDLADSDLQYPSINFCAQLGECGLGPGGSTRYPGAHSFPVCATAPGAARPDWVCNYPATVETVAGNPNSIVTQESICDGKDNDCDGASDEHTTNRPGTACAEATGMGECQRHGTYRCQATPGSTPPATSLACRRERRRTRPAMAWTTTVTAWWTRAGTTRARRPSPAAAPTPAGACATTWAC
jgi:hypothetical protein